MAPEQLAALYVAAEAVGDPPLVIALTRAMSNPEFARQARALLEASPESRRALAGVMACGRVHPANG